MQKSYVHFEPSSLKFNGKAMAMQYAMAAAEIQASSTDQMLLPLTSRVKINHLSSSV
jgi:hypothetical protein